MAMTTLTDLLSTIDGFDDVATTELAKVTASVHAGNGPGEITIKIRVERDKSGALMIAPTVKSKVPIVGVAPVIRYRGEDGEVTDEDPAQPTLFPKIGRRRKMTEAD